MSADLPPREDVARLRRDETRWLERCRERLSAHHRPSTPHRPTPPQRPATTRTEEDR